MVLGGATYSPDPPRPMVEVNEHGDRLFYAAKLYRVNLSNFILNWAILKKLKKTV